MDREEKWAYSGEIRAASRGLSTMLQGHAIVFNRLSLDLGDFREQIAPQALDRIFANPGVDLRALVNHNPDRLLGRMGSGTLRIAKDAKGLAVEIDPPNGEATLIELVKRGDINGMSFAFIALRDAWDETTKPWTRTVLDMEVREVSVVTWPAYPQTDVSMRSAGARSLEAYRAHRPGQSVTQRLEALRRKRF
jgi:uncharacterized protein